MPEKLKHSLKKTAKKRRYGKRRTGAYVYGTLRRTGWKPSRKKRTKKRKWLTPALYITDALICMPGKIQYLSVKKILYYLDIMRLRKKGTDGLINESILYKLHPAQKLKVIIYDNEIVLLEDLCQETRSVLISAGNPGWLRYRQSLVISDTFKYNGLYTLIIR